MNHSELAYYDRLLSKIDKALNHKVSPFLDDNTKIFLEKLEVCERVLGDIKNDIQLHIQITGSDSETHHLLNKE